MRLIDADALKKDLTRFYDNEVTAKRLIDEQPTIEPMRKRGKWIEVHGYCTPGGDPVWHCSNCGKGEHVYGVEHNSYGARVADYQWVACPNCGWEMEN